MTAHQSSFLNELQWRGYIHQGTDLEGLDELLLKGPVSAYIGFDATADSLHVGSLIQIMMLTHLQRHGHRPVVLMGGGTSKVGDPTGKDAARQYLTDETIAHNIKGIQQVFAKFLTFGAGKTDAIMLNNADWLDTIKYMDFLRDYGRFFSINRMLTFDSVKLRLEREQPLTFLEFNYMILQGFDFAHLAKTHDCRLQLGGSDQWGNIVAGIDLGRRMDLPQLYGLTSPLLATSSGAKMGKTASGAIWLNQERLSAYEYWQFWRNTEDSDVIRFMKLFTLLPQDEIEDLAKFQGQEINLVKKRLADEATALLHGSNALPAIHQTASALFESGTAGLDALEEITLSPEDFIAEGISLLHLLVQAGLTTSNGEGRRMIRGKAIRINQQLIDAELHQVLRSDFEPDGSLIISSGKKKYICVKLIS